MGFDLLTIYHHQMRKTRNVDRKNATQPFIRAIKKKQAHKVTQYTLRAITKRALNMTLNNTT